jgi:hypothetical protein
MINVKMEKIKSNTRDSKRNKLTVLAKGEEEAQYNVQDQLEKEREEDEQHTQKKNKSSEIESEDSFCDQMDLAETGVYFCKFKRDKEPIVWNIRMETYYIADDPYLGKIKNQPYTVFKKEIDFRKPIHENFFEHMWPDLKGRAEIVDKYHASPQSAHYNTVKNEGIKFHDEEHADPDWKLKQYILGVIAATCEIEKGFNLWNAGQLGKRSLYPDFGKYVLLNGMKAFLNTLPYIFVDKEFWYTDKRNIPWEMFMPTISGFNNKRMELLSGYCMVLDKLMSGWRPNTSKLSGLPNYTWEPRKSIPLGTIFLTCPMIRLCQYTQLRS